MSSFREIINRWLESGGQEGREEVDKAVRDNEEAARYLAGQLAIEEALEEMADEDRMRRWEQAHRNRIRRRWWWLGGACVLGLLLLAGAVIMLTPPRADGPDGFETQQNGTGLTEETTTSDPDTALGQTAPPTSPVPPAVKPESLPATPGVPEKEPVVNENRLPPPNPATQEKNRQRYRRQLVTAGGNWQNAYAEGRYEEAARLLEEFFETRRAADFPEQAFILGLLKLLYLPEPDYPASARLLDAARQGINLAPGKYAWIEADVDMWRYLAYSRQGGESALERAQALREAHPGIVDSLRTLLAD